MFIAIVIGLLFLVGIILYVVASVKNDSTTSQKGKKTTIIKGIPTLQSPGTKIRRSIGQKKRRLKSKMFKF